jgi:acyl transferase domain-containing protein
MLPGPGDSIDSQRYMVERVGKLWLYGVSIDWRLFHGGGKKMRLPLPLYPFEKIHYPIESNINLLSARRDTPVQNIEAEVAVPGSNLYNRPRPELSVSYVPPREKNEILLAEMWQNLLGISEIGIKDNFFELGATSLHIGRIARLLEEKINKSIPVVAMFTYPTISQLNDYLNRESSQPAFSDDEILRLEKKTTNRGKLKQRKQSITKGNQHEIQ